MRTLAALAVACVAIACSDAPEGDPAARAEVATAFGALADPEPLTVTLSLPEADADDLFELSVGIDRATAAFLEDARMTIKNDFAVDPVDSHVSIRFDVDGASIEARQLDEDLYVRGELAALARSFGVPPPALATVLSGTRELRPYIRLALRGGWIHVPGGGALLAPSSNPAGPGPSQRAADAIAAAVEDGASVTEHGTDEVGTRYRVEVDLARFTEAFYDAAEGLVPRPPPEAIEAVPEETVTLEAWLEEGSLRRVEADVAHLIDIDRGGASDRSPLILRIDLDPFEAMLRRPKPEARIPAGQFLRLLEAAESGV